MENITNFIYAIINNFIPATLTFLILFLLIFWFTRVAFDPNNQLSTFKISLIVGFITLIILDVWLLNLISTNIFWNNIIVKLSIFFYLTILIYYLLYTWRQLSLSLFSYLCFLCNVFIFLLYINGISLIFIKMKQPIYIEDLSQLSVYRYNILLFLTVFCIIIYFSLKIISPSILDSTVYKSLMFPHLKDEVFNLFYTWNDSYFGIVCNSIAKSMLKSTKKQRFIYILHFFVTWMIPFIAIVLFINFTVFHDDLRLNFYFLPVLFICWIFKFFIYYFEQFIAGSFKYINMVVKAKPRDSNIIPIKKDNFILIDSSYLLFEITDFGTKEGFASGDLKYLATCFSEYPHLYYLFFEKYKKKLFFLHYFLIFLRVICWSYISYKIFSNIDYTLYGPRDSIFFLIFKRSFHSSTPTQAPVKAFFIKRNKQSLLENETNGAYKNNHMFVVNDTDINENGHCRGLAGATHGKGSVDNPSQNINPAEDLLGNP